MKALVLGTLAFVAVFIAAFLAVGEFVYHYSISVHRFPIIIGTATILLAAFAFVRTLRRPSPEDAADGETQAAPAAWPRGTTGALVWLAAALPMVIFLGYLVGPSLYLLLYLRLHSERWLTAVAFAAGAAAVIYFGFHDLLAVRVPLYPFWWTD